MGSLDVNEVALIVILDAGVPRVIPGCIWLPQATIAIPLGILHTLDRAKVSIRLSRAVSSLCGLAASLVLHHCVELVLSHPREVVALLVAVFVGVDLDVHLSFARWLVIWQSFHLRVNVRVLWFALCIAGGLALHDLLRRVRIAKVLALIEADFLTV